MFQNPDKPSDGRYEDRTGVGGSLDRNTYGNRSRLPQPDRDFYQPPAHRNGYHDTLDTDSFEDEEMQFPRRDPEQLLQQRRGRLVSFYRNGDPHFKGLQTAISLKLFPTVRDSVSVAE